MDANEKLLELYRQSDSCVRCGRCTTVCPTYRATHREPMVARGRIWLARQFVEGRLGPSATLKLYNDLCLGCRACRAVCPPKIQVDELVAEIKQNIQAERGQTFEDRMMLQVVAHPQSFRYLVKMLDLSRRTGTTRLLPGDLREKIRMFPPAAPSTFLEWLHRRRVPDTQRRGKVGYFPGCLTNSIFPGIGISVLKVLERQGIEVVVPPEVVCCGQPYRASGVVDEGRRFALSTMEFFLASGVDHVLTSCGSCCHSLREYASDFRDDPARAQMAALFSSKCMDVMEFLVDVAGVHAGPLALPEMTVAYHDSCHLNRRLGISSQPRKLLAALPGVHYAEMPRADWCCGAAGSYSFKHPEIARKILSQKTGDALLVRPRIVTAGCPSCLMQLQYGSGLFGGGFETCHPVELLARTYDPAGRVE